MSQPSWQPAASAVDQDADEWLFPINGAYEGVLWTGLQVRRLAGLGALLPHPL